MPDLKRETHNFSQITKACVHVYKSFESSNTQNEVTVFQANVT